ncbi:MAG TPA: DUF2975 domain-containing protein [Clostridiales bacterium]|nr:DUF2975 domain-containing protein [Clostridiales bacterium]
MNQANLSKWLKAIAVAISIILTLTLLIIIPQMGRDIVRYNPEFSNLYYIWLSFIWTMGIPCYFVVVFFWRISNEIGKNNSFSDKNINSLIWISRLTLFDTIYCFIGNLILLILNMSHPGILIIFLFVIFIGIVIAIVSGALSHLAKKANTIEKENELTV